MVRARTVSVPGMLRLPTFSHAVVAGDFIYVSGIVGTAGEEIVLVEGGIGPETAQILENIERILDTCDADRHDIVKVDIFLRDMADFELLNETYQDFFGDDPPARITVAAVDLALGAAVEIDCVAYKPR